MINILLLALSASAVELSKDTWDDATAGKTVFVKFLAPWCGHCKKMKPDWDKLMVEYADNAKVLVADVDCTTGGKDLCTELGVKGYPTIKHGDPNNLEDYKGGRDFKSMQKFASDLKPGCGPAALDNCDDEQKAKIEELMALSASAIDAQITEQEQEQKDAEEFFKTEVEKLQKAYEKLSSDKDEKVEAVKSSGLGLMKAVKAHAKSKSEL